MIPADLGTSGVVVINGTVIPLIVSASVPAVPKGWCQWLDCDENRRQLRRLWHVQPRQVLG